MPWTGRYAAPNRAHRGSPARVLADAYLARTAANYPARAQRALVAVIQEAYVEGVSTRQVDDLVQALGINGVSKSHVSRLCTDWKSHCGQPHEWRREQAKATSQTRDQHRRDPC